MFNKKLEDFISYEKIIPILGEQSCEGAFSIIEPAEYNRIKVAVKKPRKINNKRKEISIDEIRKHDYFYCKNVINFRGITRSPNEIDCLVMDYAENGNLHKYLSEHPLELDVKLKMSINIAEGLFECHRHKIMNLNINSENILVDKNLELKIGGFGYNINRDFDNEDFVRWAAPEKFSEDSQCKENPIHSDIYSYGLVVWEIATNGKEKNDEIKSTKTSGNNDYLIYELEQIDTPNRLIKIIKDCCNSNPSMRSTLAKVILDLKSLSPPREDWRLFLPRTNDDAKLPEYTSIQNCSDKDLTWEEIFTSPGKLNIEFLERGLRLMILKIEEHDSEFFTNYLKNDLSKDDNGLWLLFFESEKCDLEIDRIYYDKNCGFIQFKEDDEKYSKLMFDYFGLDYKKIVNESERSIINFRIIYEAGIIDKENSVQIMDPDEYKFEKQKIELRKKEFKDKAKNISTMYSAIENHIDEAQYHQKIEGINLEMLKEKKYFNHEEWNKRLIWLSDRANYALFRFKLKKSNLALLNKYFFKDKYILNHPQLNDETELILYDKRFQFYVSSESLPAFKQIPDDLNVIISIVDDYDKTFHQHYSKYKEIQLKEYVYDNIKQVQQLSVNYIVANNQQEKDMHERKKYRENSKPRKEIVCYRCGKKGHIARYYNVRRVNYCDYKYEEDKVYVVDKRKQQAQPDTAKKRSRLQPESK
ncbi:14766_t:CDS:2, partial [Dentiscutata heterogama]